MTGTSATVTHLLMESQFFAELKTTISCCEALGFNPLSHPERFSSLPLLIRFGMLRNFFIYGKGHLQGGLFLCVNDLVEIA